MVSPCVGQCRGGPNPAAYEKREQDDARYSWFNPGYQFMVQQRERRLLALLHRYGFTALGSKTIVEVGCGTGQWLREFLSGARPENITGIDLLEDRVSRYRERGSRVRGVCAYNARARRSFLSLRKGLPSFFKSTVFTSILDADLKQTRSGRNEACGQIGGTHSLVRLPREQSVEQRCPRSQTKGNLSAVS